MLSLNCKNVQHVKIYRKVPQLKMSDNCVKSYSSWNAFFFTFTAFGYSNNQREATLLQNVKKQKLNFENHWHIWFFFTAILTYIKGGNPCTNFFGEGGLQWRGLHLLFFLTEVIKFYWHVIIPRWAIQAPGSL